MCGTEISTETSDDQNQDQRDGAESLPSGSRISWIDAFCMDTDEPPQSGRTPPCPWNWRDRRIHSVYALIDPRDNATYYIGYTHWNVQARLSAHSSDPSSAAYHRIREIRQAGLTPIIKELARFLYKSEALREEVRLIATRPGLLNRSPGCVGYASYAMSPDQEEPTTEPDGDFLEYQRSEEI